MAFVCKCGNTVQPFDNFKYTACNICRQVFDKSGKPVTVYSGARVGSDAFEDARVKKTYRRKGYSWKRG